MAAGAKRLMDVEDVVAWACSQELVKKRPASSGRHLPTMDLERGDGELVGRWTRPFGFPSISPMFRPGFGGGASRQRGGEPDPDALIVEAAILALPPRIVGLEPPAALAEGIGLLPIDVAGAFAAAVANIVNIVLAYGRLGKRPALGDDPPTVRPRLAANGKPGVWIMRRELEPTLDGAGVERALEQPGKAIRKDVYAPGSFCRNRLRSGPAAHRQRSRGISGLAPGARGARGRTLGRARGDRTHGARRGAHAVAQGGRRRKAAGSLQAGRRGAPRAPGGGGNGRRAGDRYPATPAPRRAAYRPPGAAGARNDDGVRGPPGRQLFVVEAERATVKPDDLTRAERVWAFRGFAGRKVWQSPG